MKKYIKNIDEIDTIQIEFDKDTANRLLNEAFDIITEIKNIIKDTNISDEEALEQIDYILRKVK